MQSSVRGQRLMRELQQMTNAPPSGIAAWLEDEQVMDHWLAEIQGVDGTPFAQGRFRLSLTISQRYPFEPPTVRFITPIYHPNIDEKGHICLDILKTGTWKPAHNIQLLLLSIRQLMCEPNGADILRQDAGELFNMDRISFEKKARQLTLQYAKMESSNIDMEPENIQVNAVNETNKSQESASKLAKPTETNDELTVEESPLIHSSLPPIVPATLSLQERQAQSRKNRRKIVHLQQPRTCQNSQDRMKSKVLKSASETDETRENESVYESEPKHETIKRKRKQEIQSEIERKNEPEIQSEIEPEVEHKNEPEIVEQKIDQKIQSEAIANQNVSDLKSNENNSPCKTPEKEKTKPLMDLELSPLPLTATSHLSSDVLFRVAKAQVRQLTGQSRKRPLSLGLRK